MEPFEYVVVLTSLILGLGIAQILTSAADIVSNVKNVKLCLPHALLTLAVFLLHIQEWWINYQYSAVVEEWTLGIVLSILIYPILLFLLARMLFPTGIRGHETDLNHYFFDQWRWFYGLALGTIVVSAWQNTFIQKLDIIESWPQFLTGSIYVVIILLNVRNSLVHSLLQIASIIGLIIFLMSDDTALHHFQVPG